MSKIQEAYQRIQDFYKQFGFTPTALTFPVTDYIELAGELYNINLVQAGTPPSLDYLSIIAIPTGKSVCIQAEHNGAVILKEDKILQLYATVNGFTGLPDLIIGPYRYPLPAAVTSTVSSTQNWTVVNKTADTTSFTLPQQRMGTSEQWDKWRHQTEPSGVALQNGIGLGRKLCSCDMVTLMNSGCNCGGS